MFKIGLISKAHCQEWKCAKGSQIWLFVQKIKQIVFGPHKKHGWVEHNCTFYFKTHPLLIYSCLWHPVCHWVEVGYVCERREKVEDVQCSIDLSECTIRSTGKRNHYINFLLLFWLESQTTIEWMTNGRKSSLLIATQLKRHTQEIVPSVIYLLCIFLHKILQKSNIVN